MIVARGGNRLRFPPRGFSGSGTLPRTHSLTPENA